MYFRDPSGNQWEMYCSQGFTALPLRVGSRAGGDYVIPFASLGYDGLVQADPDRVPAVRAADYNHMTLPTRDHEECKRFWMRVFGGRLTNDNTDHKTVEVGRSEIGLAPFPGGWTAPDALYPYYTLDVEADALVALRGRLESFGIPTHRVVTRDGEGASTYFRDPSGNLGELYCRSGFTGPADRIGRDESAIDVRSLNYDRWKDPGR
jgi:catechol 2,3-dioxygenase-like lactoylglutathione lyase family enzyme